MTYRLDEEKDTAYPDLSARHADWALSSLNRAWQATDSREKATEAMIAHTLAVLSLRDKADELVSVLKQKDAVPFA